MVLPDAPCAHPLVDAWVKAESAHFIRRWRSLMRGEPIVKKPAELTPEEKNGTGGVLCLWGDPKGNSLLASMLSKLPLTWTDNSIGIAGKTFDAATHVPVLACLARLRPGEAQPIVLNTGLTFREDDDRSNALQNPQLPDWAILDITQAPNLESAGRVEAADFFDLHWQAK